MKISILYVILLLVILCTPKGLDEPKPFPTIPVTFRATFEISNLQTNTSYTIDESWDYVVNKARISRYFHDSRVVDIYDFDTQTRYHAFMSHHNCTVSTYTELPRSHIHDYPPDLEWKYVGEEQAEGGIWAEVWKSVDEEGGEYKFYFSGPNWRIDPGYGQSWDPSVNVPLQLITPTRVIDIMNYMAGHWEYEQEFQIPSVCFVEEEKPFPTLPKVMAAKFSTTNEAMRITSFMTEYYDEINNRARLDYTDHNSSLSVWVDVNKQITYTYDNTHGFCEKYYGIRNPMFVIEDDQLISPFRLLGNAKDHKYLGRRLYRGILCDTWISSEIRDESGNYTVTFYSAVPEWSFGSIGNRRMPGRYYHEHAVPIGARITGLFGWGRFVRQDTIDMDFFDFMDGPNRIPSSVWTLPRNCFAEEDDIEIPDLPKAFMATITTTDVLRGVTTTTREYVDEKLERIRYDRFTDRMQDTTIAFVYPEKTLYHYQKYYANDYGQCRKSDLNSTRHRIPIEHGHLMSVGHMFRFGVEYNETYLGQAVVRGVVCDHWDVILVNDTTMSPNPYVWVIEYFFAVKGWRTRNANGDRIPVRIHTRAYPHYIKRGNSYQFGGKPVYDQIMEFSNFQNATPPPEVWELPTACLDSLHSTPDYTQQAWVLSVGFIVIFGAIGFGLALIAAWYLFEKKGYFRKFI